METIKPGKYIELAYEVYEVEKKEFYMPFVFIDGKADEEQINKILSLLNPLSKN